MVVRRYEGVLSKTNNHNERGNMKYKNIFAVAVPATLFALTGCHVASPRLSQGYYFMAGDSKCVSGTHISRTRIMCKDTKGIETGYRDAMEDYELRMYQKNISDLNQSLQALGNTASGLANQFQQQSQSYTPPTIQPVSPYTNSYNPYGGSIFNNNSGYNSSSGTRYQYDLSNPSDRLRYSTDLDAQRRDQMNLNPSRKLDQGIGQFGGGIDND
mgnify:CR=1 FL=1